MSSLKQENRQEQKPWTAVDVIITATYLFAVLPFIGLCSIAMILPATLWYYAGHLHY
jgi:hypothetical protein